MYISQVRVATVLKWGGQNCSHLRSHLRFTTCFFVTLCSKHKRIKMGQRF